MAVSTIDGTLEEAVLKRVRRNLRVYERLTFRLRDGGTKSVAKAIVDQPVAERLLPGTSGRFYLYTAVDHRGLHGVRDDSGKATFGYARNNEKAMMIVIPLLLVWVVVAVVLVGGIPILPTIILLISIPFFFIYRSTRIAAQRQFDADSAWAPPPTAPLAAEPAASV